MKFEKKNGSAASEEKSFENVNGQTGERTDRRTNDGQKVITKAYLEHSSDELITLSGDLRTLVSIF